MKNQRITIIIICTLVLSGLTISAGAHVPFLKPNQFEVLHQRLQIESAFTELPFQADFAMDAPFFSIIAPDGTLAPITPTAKTTAAVYLEPEISDEGTYRITTGIRKGPKYNAVETADGKLYFAEDMERVDGKKTFMQYYNSADTYIMKGNPDYKSMPLNKGVEIIPLSSPNRLDLGDKLSFHILDDGKPVANARIVVVYDNEHYEEHRDGDLYDVENIRESNIYADSEGRFTFTPKQAGLVLLFVTIHKKTDDTLWESWNTSLTLEVRLPGGKPHHH